MNRILFKGIKNINSYLLIALPQVAILPQEFAELNETHLEEVINQITKKSVFLENIFLYVIRLILFRINDKYSFKVGDEIYDFFNIPVALEPNKDTDGEAKNDGKFALIN